jgi:hypothetical protein
VSNLAGGAPLLIGKIVQDQPLTRLEKPDRVMAANNPY